MVVLNQSMWAILSGDESMWTSSFERKDRIGAVDDG